MRRAAGVFCGLAALVLCGTALGVAVVRLDLKRIVATRQYDLFTLRIDLKAPWRSASLVGANRLRVLYDVTGDGKADYVGVIGWRGGALVETLSGRGDRFEPVRVSRPTTSAARFTHPVGPMFPGAKHLGAVRIAVEARTSSRVDRLPRTGWFLVPAPPEPPPRG
jgi:hypothetical protein